VGCPAFMHPEVHTLFPVVLIHDSEKIWDFDDID
jgi:hypothetical protein